MHTTKKLIKVYNENTIDFFVKKSDVAKKFEFTPQHIGNILNGKTKKKYIVYNNTIYNIEYETSDEMVKTSINKCEEKKKEITIKDPNDYFILFLNEKMTNTKDKNDYLKVSEIYNSFRLSNFYLDRDKNIRKKFLAYKDIKKICETNEIIGISFKKKFDRKINDKRIALTNVLVGYTFKNAQKDDTHI